MDDRIEDAYLRVCENLFKQADTERSSWQRVVNKVMPKLVVTAVLHEENAKDENERICSQANIDILKLASAHMSYIYPSGHQWFKFESWKAAEPDETEDESDSWFAYASDVSRREIERSNFYSELHSAIIDSCTTGSGLMHIGIDSNNDVLVFNHVPAGTFGVAQNAQHVVDTAARKFKYTPAQLEEAFGLEALTNDMREAYNDAGRRYDFKEAVEVWHLVAPSRDFYGDNDHTRVFPYVSVYLSPRDKKILKEEQMEEFPYVCFRFVNYGNSPYGVSPLLAIEGDIDALMKAEDVLTLLGQRAALPSVIIPPDMVGEVDLRAGGQTVIPMQYINAQVPREWAMPGNYQIGIDQVERLNKKIDDALYVSVLQIISQTDRYMTATEVNSREAEKLMTFTPVFTQAQVDGRQMMNRIFALLVRAQKINLEKMPDELVQVEQLDDAQNIKLLTPKMSYIGRLAQAMERIQSSAADGFLAKLLQVTSATQDPTGLSLINWQKYWRKEAYSCGMPACYLKTEEQVKREMQELQMMREQQQMQQAALAESEAARNNAAAQNYRQQYQQ
jgi:hypothetical protein